MRTLLALLASLPGLAPAPAQAQVMWSGASLSITGHRSNGCDLHVMEVFHTGRPLSSVSVVLVNRAPVLTNVMAEVTLTGQDQRKRGTIGGAIGGSQWARLTGFQPFGGSLTGTTMAIRFLGCSPG